MEPSHYKFGGGPTETVLHPIVLLALVTVTIMLLVLPRKHIIATFLFGTFLIPAGQELLLAGIHVFAYRIIVLAALLRMVRSRQTPRLAGKWNSVYTAVLFSILYHMVAFSFLYS